MDITAEIKASLADEWLPNIYESKIRPQRTRSTHLDIPTRENIPEIQYTLLGIELKVGKRRFACPDLATARYMRVFARLGVCDFAIPYDITKISPLADELETSWQRTIFVVTEVTKKESDKAKKLAKHRLVKAIRTEIESIGPGAAMPEFNRETNQRPG